MFSFCAPFIDFCSCMMNMQKFLTIVKICTLLKVLTRSYEYGMSEDNDDAQRLANLQEAARDTPYFIHNNCTGPLDAAMDKAWLTILPMNIQANQTLILWAQTTACCKVGYNMCS